MKKVLAVLISLLIFLLVNYNSVFADVVGCGCYCGKVIPAPCTEEDCKRECGWQEPSATTPSSSPSSSDYEAERQRQQEAERQRQRELEEQLKREEEKAKRRHEEFERNRQEALKQIKGIAENELELKGTDVEALGLKEAPTSSPNCNCEWGNMGSSVVDLRCLGLDPNKPITVDPHVVRGQERVFPAQIDSATFENTNYNKGFEALMHFDVASAATAVEYFKQAQKERPNDPLVRNALMLAEDILKARKQKEKDDQAQVAYFTMQSYAALMIGDNENAKTYIAQARKLDPNNNNTKFVESLTKLNTGSEGTYPERQKAYRLVANSLVSITKQNFSDAIGMLEAAQLLQPQDQFIDMFLHEMRYYNAGVPQ
jgi:tetratricopeptide (TPR) repeat protein